MNHMAIFELLPTKGQRSFYGKAVVSEMFGIMILNSYGTMTCLYDRGAKEFVRLWGGYSVTTLRHVNAFRDAVGLPSIPKAEWLAMPCKEL